MARFPSARSRAFAGALQFGGTNSYNGAMVPHLMIALAAALLAAAPLHAAQDDLRLEVARQWAEKGDYERAVQELRLFLNEHPDAAEVYARIGTLRLRQGNLQLAGENFKVALRKDPRNQEAKEGQAKLKDLESKPASGPEALAAPASPRRSPPAPTPGPVRIGGDAAYSPALDSLAVPPQGIYLLPEFQEALRLYRAREVDAALLQVRKVLEKNPGHSGAYYLGGVIRYEKGELDKAEFNFKRASGYPQRGFNAHYYLARIHHREHRVPAAIEAYGKYLESARNEAGRKQAQEFRDQLRGMPSDPTADRPADRKSGRPAAAAGRGGSEGAGSDGRGKESTGKETPGKETHGKGDHGKEAHGNRGQTGHGHEASADAPKPDRPAVPLILTAPGWLPFVVADSAGSSGRRLVEAYDAFKKEKFERSAEILKDIIRLYGGSPNAEAASLDLAAVYVRLGLWDQAKGRILDYLARAAEPQRYRDLAFYLEGLMHLGRKDGAKAERALLKVKAGGYGGPGRDEIDARLAEAAGLQQDKGKWAGYLEKALASAPDGFRKARIQQQLGRMHGKFGRPEKAVEHWRKSLAECGKAPAGGGGAGSDAAEWADLCAESQLRVADLEFRRKRWKEALAEYRKFAATWPEHKENAWVQYQIANVHQATRNLESALNEYRKVIDNYPGSYWASQAQWKREDAIWRKEYEEVLD